MMLEVKAAHLKIEEALARVLGTEEEIRAVVIARPEKKKGND